MQNLTDAAERYDRAKERFEDVLARMALNAGIRPKVVNCTLAISGSYSCRFRDYSGKGKENQLCYFSDLCANQKERR